MVEGDSRREGERQAHDLTLPYASSALGGLAMTPRSKLIRIE